MPSSAPAPSPMIRTEQLTRRFGELTAVDRLDLEIARGEIFGLVGPDGAGKSTTLRMLATVLDPSAGEARVAGCDIRTQAAEIKDQLAYMSQRFGLYGDLTVQENIDFYADLYGEPRRERAGRIADLLDFSNMGPFRERRAAALSGGMKQKLQLVCALIHTPRLLLLDEPTNGVDPLSRRDFWRILYRLLRQGVTIVVTTAYLDEAERCHRVGLLDRGRLLSVGTPEDVKGLMREQVLVLRSAHVRQITALLRTDLPEALSVTPFGDRVHVVTGNIAATRKAAETIVRRQGLVVDEWRTAAPSLEDLFVRLLGRERQGEASGGALAVELQSPLSAPPGPGYARAVKVAGLTRRFGDFTAVDRISFEVPPGEIFGFLGPNGAGKSTTIRMLCGLLAPSAGSGEVAGCDIATQPEAIKQRIGYMSQKFSLYEDLSVAENIDFYGGIYGLSGGRLQERKAWALAMAGLEDRRRRLTRLLSGGWKQRLALACAVLHAPPIVFLDEPTSGVDPLSRRRFWDLIYAMAAQGVTIFVTTHYMEEAEYCDRVALIYQGRMIALGSPRELKASRMHGQLLELRCPRPQEALEAVESLPGVADAALFGAALHVTVADAHRTAGEITALMERRGTPAERIERIAPSMEDLFVALIEAEDRRKSGGRP